MICPKCGSQNVSVQVFQENTGSVTKTHTKYKFKEKGHGIIWWIAVGWWWCIIDFFSWFLFFFPRLLLRLFSSPFKKKKYVGNSTGKEITKNKIKYKQICICQSCGHQFKAQNETSSQVINPSSSGSDLMVNVDPAQIAGASDSFTISGVLSSLLFLAFSLMISITGIIAMISQEHYAMGVGIFAVGLVLLLVSYFNQ